MSENDCDWLCSPHVGGAPSVERRFTWGWVSRVLAPVETIDPSLTDPSVIRYEEINFRSLYLIEGDKFAFSHRKKNFLSHPITSFLFEDFFEILTF